MSLRRIFCGETRVRPPARNGGGTREEKKICISSSFSLLYAAVAALLEGICQFFVEIVKCVIVKEFLGCSFRFLFCNTNNQCHLQVVQNPVSSPSFRPKCREFWIFHASFRPLQEREIKPSVAQPPFADIFIQQCKQRISHINIRKFQRNVKTICHC